MIIEFEIIIVFRHSKGWRVLVYSVSHFCLYWYIWEIWTKQSFLWFILEISQCLRLILFWEPSKYPFDSEHYGN